MAEEKLPNFKSFAEACAAFKMTSPMIFINYDENSGDKVFARQVAADLKEEGLEVWFDEDKLLPGQDHKREISIAIQECSHMIDIVSSRRGEGMHIKNARVALERSMQLVSGKTHLFPLAATDEEKEKFLSSTRERQRLKIGTWEEESKKISFVVGMMIAGPTGRGYEADEFPADDIDKLIVIGGVESPPSECPACGAPIEDHYTSNCTYCKYGVTHYEKPQENEEEKPYEMPAWERDALSKEKSGDKKNSFF